VKLDVVDWDGDGRLDVTRQLGERPLVSQLADRNGKVVLKKIGNLARRNVSSHTTSPPRATSIADGKPDLVMGAEDGLLYFIKHDDCIRYAADDLRAGSPKMAVDHPRFPGLVSEELCI
jgi:hypothetical protein